MTTSNPDIYVFIYKSLLTQLPKLEKIQMSTNMIDKLLYILLMEYNRQTYFNFIQQNGWILHTSCWKFKCYDSVYTSLKWSRNHGVSCQNVGRKRKNQWIRKICKDSRILPILFLDLCGWSHKKFFNRSWIWHSFVHF